MGWRCAGGGFGLLVLERDAGKLTVDDAVGSGEEVGVRSDERTNERTNDSSRGEGSGRNGCYKEVCELVS